MKRTCVALIIFCLSLEVLSTSSISGVTGDGYLDLNYINTSLYPDAVCNDGSPAAFWMRKSPIASTTWIVHLQGGWWCWDYLTCMERWLVSSALMSSKGYPNQISIGGIMSSNSTVNPYLSQANHIYVAYCSSDAWTGNGTGLGWKFAGLAIIQAVISTTVFQSNQKAMTVLLSGCSAGGQGVVNTLDMVYDYIMKNIPNRISSIRGMADAGWMMDIKPIIAGHLSSGDQFKLGYDLWKGVPNTECAISNYGNEYMCYLSPFVKPYIRTPILIQTNQYDAFQDPWDCCSYPFTPAEAVIAEKIRLAFNHSLEIVTPPSGVFSAACYLHCITESNSFMEVKISGMSLSVAIGQWLFEGKNVYLSDTCDGVNCSKGCTTKNSV